MTDKDTTITLKRDTQGGGSKKRKSRIDDAKKHIRGFKYNLSLALRHAEAILDSRMIPDMGMRKEIARFVSRADDWHKVVGKW
jgi:hypothetical protein